MRSEGIIIHTILIGLHERNLSFFTMQNARRLSTVEQHTRCSIEKYVHSKWKLIFSSHAVIGEIDDDDDGDKKNEERSTARRLQIALQHELSLYHFTPATRDYRARLFIKNRFYWIILAMASRAQLKKSAKHLHRKVISLWARVVVGHRIHSPNYRRSRRKTGFHNKLKTVHSKAI